MSDRRKEKVNRISDMLNIDKGTVQGYLEAYAYDEDKTIQELLSITEEERPKYLIT